MNVNNLLKSLAPTAHPEFAKSTQFPLDVVLLLLQVRPNKDRKLCRSAFHSNHQRKPVIKN